MSKVSAQVVVVGGGAAGMLCAGTAAARGRQVLVVDKNRRPARKVVITGKGRCNVTNCCDPADFLKMVRANPRFLYSALNRFSPAETMDFFERQGVPLKVERGNRVFPVSDRSLDIVDALERYCKENGARYHTGVCTGVRTENGRVTGVELEDEGFLPAQSVVIATGGKSYPLTGSTGDGYRLAQACGHAIVPPTPSLIPLETQEPCAKMMGLSLRNVTLRLIEKKRNKTVYSELGEMLFTHFGVSGPLVLTASTYLTKVRPQDFFLAVDLKPGLDERQLAERLIRDFDKYKNKDFANSLGELLPRKLIPEVVRRSGIPAGQKVHQVTREQRGALASVIKNFTLHISRTRPIEEAIVTAGGVDVRQIKPGTMESRLVEGLFFAGEVLDLDACTGGYNLQIAFSTGFLAGENV